MKLRTADDVEKLFDRFAKKEASQSTVTKLITNIRRVTSRNKNRIKSIKTGFKLSCFKHLPSTANNEKLRIRLFGAIYDINPLLPFDVVQYVQGIVTNRALKAGDFWVKISEYFDVFVDERNEALRKKQRKETVPVPVNTVNDCVEDDEKEDVDTEQLLRDLAICHDLLDEHAKKLKKDSIIAPVVHNINLDTPKMRREMERASELEDSKSRLHQRILQHNQRIRNARAQRKANSVRRRQEQALQSLYPVGSIEYRTLGISVANAARRAFSTVQEEYIEVRHDFRHPEYHEDEYPMRYSD